MNEKQPAIFVIGAGLVLANLVGTPQGKAIFDVIFNGVEHHNALDLQKFVLELAFVGLLVFVAGINDKAGTLIIVFLLAMWAAFLLQRTRKG